MNASFILLSLLILFGFILGFFGLTAHYLQIPTRARMLVVSVACFLFSLGIAINSFKDPLQEEGILTIPRLDFPLPREYGTPSQSLSLQGQKKFTEIKKISLPSAASAPPVLWKDLLIFGTEDSVVRALSRTSGEPVWTLTIKNPLSVLGLSAIDGKLFAGEKENSTGSSNFYCIEAQTGKVLWMVSLLGGAKTNPSADKSIGLLLIGTTTGASLALHYASGEKHWKTELGPLVAETVFFNKKAFILSNRSDLPGKTALRALVTNNSREYWHTFLEGEPMDLIAIDEKTDALLILTMQHRPTEDAGPQKAWIQMIIHNGKMRWRAEVPPDTLPSLLYSSREKLVVFTTRSGFMIALNIYDGKELWRAEVGKETRSGPSLFFPLSNPIIAAVSHDGVFSLRRAHDGKEIARSTLEPGATVPPVMSEDSAYVLTPGHLHIFGGLMSLKDKPSPTPTKPTSQPAEKK